MPDERDARALGDFEGNVFENGTVVARIPERDVIERNPFLHASKKHASYVDFFGREEDVFGFSQIRQLSENFTERRFDRLERSIEPARKRDEEEELPNGQLSLQHEVGADEHDRDFDDELQKFPAGFENPPEKVYPVLAVDRRAVEAVDAAFFGFFANEEANDANILERVRKPAAGTVPIIVGGELLFMGPFSNGNRDEGKKRNECQNDEHHPVIHVQSQGEKT